MWLFLLIGWNVLTLTVYGIDKLCARLGTRRISEQLLISFAFLMGGAGALLGMGLFRHKIRKPKFCIFVPLALITNLAILAGIFRFLV